MCLAERNRLRAWPHRDRAANNAIAPENDKWNSVIIHAKFARTSREIRESACLTESEAFANAQRSVSKFARTSREFGVEDNAYLTFRRSRSLSTSLCWTPLCASNRAQRGAAAERGPGAWGAV